MRAKFHSSICCLSRSLSLSPACLFEHQRCRTPPDLVVFLRGQWGSRTKGPELPARSFSTVGETVGQMPVSWIYCSVGMMPGLALWKQTLGLFRWSLDNTEVPIIWYSTHTLWETNTRLNRRLFGSVDFAGFREPDRFVNQLDHPKPAKTRKPL